MANAGSKGVVKYTETFATDTIGTASGDGLAWTISSDTNDTALPVRWLRVEGYMLQVF